MAVNKQETSARKRHTTELRGGLYGLAKRKIGQITIGNKGERITAGKKICVKCVVTLYHI